MEENTNIAQQNTPDASTENLLDARIQTLESKLTQLESQQNSFNFVPIFLAAIIGAILGSIFTAVIFRQLLSGNNRSKKGRLAAEQTQPNQEVESQTTQYLTATVNHLSTKFKTISEQVKNLESQLSDFEVGSRSSSQSISNTLQSSETNLEQTTPSYLSESRSETATKNDYSISLTPKLVDIYNRDRNALSYKGIEVAETEESSNNRRLSETKVVIFENKRQGNYRIVKEKGINYLIPQPNFQIDASNYSEIQAVFECQNYSANYSNFQLVQPATVLPISGGLNWCLEERGILKF
ncbi:hypothetical protein [Merismopedia glauca]|uniref:Uncharacterized protein n=1 Tax=Merismopedia glauca CCAP 1448/3 TaxID=1296344 RepID=A0A2T1C7M4_9CYAN|nr:hypothetical protein [Merismopedia glauca]PSB04282.1 hypothetical protein C7B64_04805 [Merismopedia glauca CCAP 1448/3]